MAEAELNEQDLNDEALRQDAILLSSMLYEEGLLVHSQKQKLVWKVIRSSDCGVAKLMTAEERGRSD